LSVVPGDVRPHTGLPGAIEHFAVYLGVCGLLAVGYEERVAASVIALVLSLGPSFLNWRRSSCRTGFPACSMWPRARAGRLLARVSRESFCFYGGVIWTEHRPKMMTARHC
jgi:hypothetical protein